jgi:DNA-binding NarL/FixJ family response regulator
MRKLKVLIVEDSPMVSLRIREMLSQVEEVSHIDEAISSSEAMSIFDSRVPDVVLLDINLPGKSGIEILKDIKQKYLSTYVIMLTNCSEASTRQLCKELGADYFFDKSAEFDKVPEALAFISNAKTDYTIPLPFIH